jgi:type VI secretion system protein ImpL
MKGALLKFIKFFVLGAAVVIVVLLVFLLVLFLGWPTWVSAFLLLGLVGILIGILFLKKLMLRRREQRFVHQIIEQDEAMAKNLAAKDLEQHRELQDQWKKSVEMLRRSHLKKAGNPLYVLPWYLVIGESGSGKTTSLNSAHLSSPFVEVNRTSGVSGTRNCDWWFFEKAVIIDTAGRYAIPVHEGRDKDEWQQFLSLIVKYRKREPIHGLIVTVAADKLLGAAAETLEEDGRKIRQRMDELMRVLGVKFPVYVLVTKCDLIQGMAAFSEQLPEKSLDQPMGLVNQDLSKDVAGFLENVVTSTGERLRTLRLLQLHQPPASGSAATGALLFPEEFENLRKGLDTFLSGAFIENPYQETPLLRGVFFSSGRQEGTPYSHFLNALGLIGEKDVLPGTSKGLFLHDFFSQVLPRDRGLFAPTRRAVEWSTLTRNLGIVSWVLLGLAMIGLLTYACVKNASTIEEAFAARPPEMKGELRTDLTTMERYRRMILNVEERNRNWWIPRFGLNQSRKVEMELKARYCRQFRDRFLVPFDGTMNDSIATFTSATPEETTSRYIEHVARRINLLIARREGGDLKALQAKPLPVFLMSGYDRGMDEDTRKQFGFLFLNYLLWRTDTGDIGTETATLQRRLVQLLAIRQDNLDWLIAWCNRQGTVPSLTLQSFWGGGVSVPGEKTIPPSFTRKGKEQINSFLAEIVAAHPEPGALERPKVAFESSYRGSCYGSWQEFASFFPRGAERLRGQKEWQAMAEKMPTDQGPYFSFFNTLTTELAPLSEPEGMPPWLRQVYQFQLLKAAGAGGTIATKTAEEGRKFIDKLEKALGRKTEGGAVMETQSVLSKAIRDYLAALAAIGPATRSRSQSYQLALQVFSDEPADKSPFKASDDALTRIRNSMGDGGADATFRGLAGGPLSFLWAFVRLETSCALQSQWEEKVLQEAQGGMDEQMMQYLLEQEGPVWKFMKGPASPFIGWSPNRGYYAKEALGGTLTLEPVFVTFLAKGAKVKKVAAAAKPKTNFVVTLKGLPTDANPEASLKPQLTRVEVQCATGSQAMENLNYPVSKTFTWTPDACSDVMFQVEVGDVTLTKRYSGPQAFSAFIQDFRGGRRTLYPSQFPGEKRALERLGIRYIRVNYQFSGDLTMGGSGGGGAKSTLPGQVPRRIARCWD